MRSIIGSVARGSIGSNVEEHVFDIRSKSTGGRDIEKERGPACTVVSVPRSEEGGLLWIKKQ
jgi:hypothetical protein